MTILSLWRHHYVAIASMFLIAVALIAEMVGCDGDQYTLTILSTEGGQVTTPGEGTFMYGNGTVVDLVATPDAGYRFDRWTHDVGTIADINVAATTVIMNNHYSITAHFVQGQEIRDWNDLDDIRDNLGGHHRLMSDLDSTTDGYQELTSPTANWGKGWQPIGTFTGSFDGHGYEIRDLFIDRPDESGVGLFGYVAEGGVVEDIGVVNATVTGKDNVGGLVGYNEKSSVSKSYSTGNVMGNTDFGGLVGLNNEGTVSSNSFWDTQTSGRTISAGGTGKTTAGMQDITTFLGARWNIYAVAPGQTSPAYIWNIVNGQTYPFLRWQSVS